MPCFFMSYSIPEPIEAFEAGDNDIIMGYDHDCGIELLGQTDEQFYYDQRTLTIQRCSRFVRQNKRRLIGHGTGDGDPLLLTA